jgi:hypothetical protein
MQDVVLPILWTLVYFTSIWYILWTFGIYYGHLVYVYYGHLVYVYYGHLAYVYYGHLVYIIDIWYILLTFGIYYWHLVYIIDIWYILLTFGIYYWHLVDFMAIWYIFPILICCIKKNLATLMQIYPSGNPALNPSVCVFIFSGSGSVEHREVAGGVDPEDPERNGLPAYGRHQVSDGNFAVSFLDIYFDQIHTMTMHFKFWQ